MKIKALLRRAFLTILIASSSVFAEVKIGIAPNVIDPNANLEMKASDPGGK